MSIIGKFHEISFYSLISTIICLCTGKTTFSALWNAKMNVINKLKRVKNIEKENKSQILRRPPIDFYKCGLKDGDELVCIEDSSIVVTINGEHKVLYNNELISLSVIMKAVKHCKNSLAHHILHITANCLLILKKERNGKII